MIGRLHTLKTSWQKNLENIVRKVDMCTYITSEEGGHLT